MGFWRVHSQSSVLYTETMKGKERVLPCIGNRAGDSHGGSIFSISMDALMGKVRLFVSNLERG